MNYKTARPIDTSACMKLIKKDLSYFPGLTLVEIEKSLRQAIADGTVVTARDGDELAGLLIFRRSPAELLFVAVDPEFRKEGVARNLFRSMCSQIPQGQKIVTISFRSDDDDYEEHTGFYISLGFKAGRMLERDGVPVQEYVYLNKTAILK